MIRLADPTVVQHPTASSIMAQEIKKTETGATSVQRYVDPFSAMRAEMDRVFDSFLGSGFGRFPAIARFEDSDACLLYTSDAADE